MTHWASLQLNGFARAAGLEPMAPYPGAPAVALPAAGTASRGIPPSGKGAVPLCGNDRTALALRLDSREAAAVMQAAGLMLLEPYPVPDARGGAGAAHADVRYRLATPMSGADTCQRPSPAGAAGPYSCSGPAVGSRACSQEPTAASSAAASTVSGPAGWWPHPAGRTPRSADPAEPRERSGPAAARLLPIHQPPRTTWPRPAPPPPPSVTATSACAARPADPAGPGPAPGTPPGRGTHRPAGHGHRQADLKAAPGQR